MKLGLIGKLFPLMFSKVVYGYTAEALPELDMRAFQKKHKKEYEAMVKRTPSVGSMKDNMFAARNAPRNGNTPWTGSSISPMTSRCRNIL